MYEADVGKFKTSIICFRSGNSVKIFKLPSEQGSYVKEKKVLLLGVNSFLLEIFLGSIFFLFGVDPLQK